jgi:hypothetical protein
MKWGLFLDLLTCFAIYNGAEPVVKKTWRYEDAIALR